LVVFAAAVAAARGIAFNGNGLPDRLPDRYVITLASWRGGASTNNNVKPLKLNPNPAPIDVVLPIDPHQTAHADNHEMTPLTLILNTLADLCPHGMLPLSYGVASAKAGGPNSIPVSACTLAGFACLGLYGLLSVGRAVEVRGKGSGGDSLSGVWGDIMDDNSMSGEKSWGSVLVDFVCFGLTVGCCLFYSAFIGDIFSSLLSGFIPSSLPAAIPKRATILVLLSLSPILPLCLLEDLEALKTSSLIGLCGILFTAMFIMLRFFDKSYSSSGKYYSMMEESLRSLPPAHPSTATPGLGGVTNLATICCVAFACHYNSVKYYLELKDRTVAKYSKTMGVGFALTCGVFLVTMVFGYLTFGPSAQALLLNNYHPSRDPLATLARLLTGVAIISGYPLMFAGLKTSGFSLAGIQDEVAKGNKKRLTDVKRKQVRNCQGERGMTQSLGGSAGISPTFAHTPSYRSYLPSCLWQLSLFWLALSPRLNWERSSVWSGLLWDRQSFTSFLLS